MRKIYNKNNEKIKIKEKLLIFEFYRSKFLLYYTINSSFLLFSFDYFL